MTVDFYKQQRVCQSKIKYSTAQDAIMAAKKHTDRAGSPHLRAYSCPVCFEWHLSTKK